MTGVIATVLSALTVITEALPVASRVTVFCGIKIALGSTPVITVARTNIPGRR
ncbi:putative transmembrane affecting septum formation and cell membrane permeability domain protein, partial [Vibrio parahaemolyticus EKP-028]